MALKKDALDRRWVEMELIVPGTPEQVWRAIATGPGISAWFWAENAPPVATEVAVTARAGGTCLVRMVHSLFASTNEWDDQLEGFESGWPGFFAVLRLYLTHFPGAPAAVLRLAGESTASEADAWSRLTAELGLVGANVGERREAPEGAPRIAGVVERVQQDAKSREIMLKLDQPGPGIAVVSTFTHAGKSQAMLSVYLYGERAKELAERNRGPWTGWFERSARSA
jgi:hypothetical protein